MISTRGTPKHNKERGHVDNGTSFLFTRVGKDTMSAHSMYSQVPLA